jgi:uncharacterized protein YndB with AHSA1/START domain
VGEYRFLTCWLIEAERERIWEAIWDSARWPQWWPGVVVAVETAPGDERGIGRRGRYEWRSRIPYPVRFEVVATRIERPSLLEGEASGELAGIGRWRLFEEATVTAVLYEWNVRTTRLWMNLLGPPAAPAFRWNHDQIMAAGARGLARLLGARLLAGG